jgi:Na+-translocating ferredoxin:NAD+ oxidoreductase RnfA subunit
MPMIAKIGFALVLAVLACTLFARTYLADSPARLRQAALYLGSLALFAASFWLWMLSAP